MKRFPIILIISISLFTAIPIRSQPFHIVLDKRFYHHLDTIHLTIYGPINHYVLIEIRDAQNVLVFWTQTIIREEGYTTINITVPEYWKYGKYILHASILGGEKISTIFMVYEKPRGNIILYTTSNITDISRINTVYIVLNPPLNTTINLTILCEEHRLNKTIFLENGYGEYSIRFNETGTYILNACWSGNQYFNKTFSTTTIEVVENISQNILGYNIYLNTSIVTINSLIEFTVHPSINLSKLNLIICSPYSEKYLYNVSNIVLFRPNFPGLWLCYLYSNGLKSRPKTFYVKDYINIIMSSDREKIYRRERVKFTVKIGKGSGKIDIYLWNNSEWVYLNSTEIYNGIAEFYWNAKKEGTYIFKAIWSGDRLHAKSESNRVKINVISKSYKIFLIILDNEDRILSGTRIIIGDKKYVIGSGIAYITLKDNIYNVTVMWRNTIIYSGYLNVCRGGYYRIKCEVYDLRIRMLDWLSNPLKNEAIYIEGGRLKLKKTTDEMGEVVFKQLPKGSYILKTNIGVKEIYLDETKTIVLKSPPPWNLIIIIILIAIIIPIIALLRKYVKIEIIIEKEEEEQLSNTPQT